MSKKVFSLGDFIRSSPTTTRSRNNVPFGNWKEEEEEEDDKFRSGRRKVGFFSGRIVKRRLIKFVLGLIVVGVIVFFYLYELHIEIQLYSKDWIKKTILPIQPLSSNCFKPSTIRSSSYNTSLVASPNYIDVQAGIAMPLGRDCFDFASTIPTSPLPGMVLAQHTIFHTYWRSDLRPLGKRQISLLQSILATQDKDSTSVILWTNSETTKHVLGSTLLSPLLALYGNRFTVKAIDKITLAKGTPMEGSKLLNLDDGRAWLDGDLVRILVLWNHGGIWVDMDTIMTGRDMRVLGESEWITQWDCYGKIYQPLNGAMMHFFQNSPYLCEMLFVMANDKIPRFGTTDWGSFLYHKVFRKLIANSIAPFKILPYCFTDGVSCRLDNRLPDPFANKDLTWGKGRMKDLKNKVDSIFAIHLHGKWSKQFPSDGYVRKFILDGVNEKIRAYRQREREI